MAESFSGFFDDVPVDIAWIETDLEKPSDDTLRSPPSPIRSVCRIAQTLSGVIEDRCSMDSVAIILLERCCALSRGARKSPTLPPQHPLLDPYCSANVRYTSPKPHPLTTAHPDSNLPVLDDVHSRFAGVEAGRSAADKFFACGLLHCIASVQLYS